MDWTLILSIGIPVLVLLIVIRFVYRTYNELTYFGLKVDKQASNIDVHLKKRYDLIPQLIETVKGYSKHETSVFTEVANLRSQWTSTKNVNEKIKTSNQLDNALSKLLMIQERYPHLKADRNFRSLQHSMSSIEREIAHERKYYNEKVREYNVRVKLFPRNIIAKLFGFKEREFFSMED